MFDEGVYRLALITLLSHPYGQPNILSSINFDFKTWDGTAPTASVFPDGCGYWKDKPLKPYACEHRWPEVRNMVAWRKVAGLSGAGLLFYTEGNVFAMTRGDDTGKAFVAVNKGASGFYYTFPARMPAGTYCNVVAQGDQKIEDCYPCKSTCPHHLTVGADGHVQVNLAGREAVAIHIQAMVTSPSNKDAEPTVAVE
jgi:alpha-amylase